MTEGTPECIQCGWKLSTDSLANFQPEQCPNCGARLKPLAVSEETGMDWVRGYFRDLKMILTHPSRFFSKMPIRGGLVQPLAFALITHWLGAALEFLWKSFAGGVMGDVFSTFTRIADDVVEIDSPGKSAQIAEIRDRLIHWFWGAGSVIMDPFLTLASILFTSFFVYLGARILVTPGKDGAPREITFESALRIVCFGMAPSILAGLPIFGTVVSYLFVAVVTIIAAREVYRIDNGRAIVVGLFPKILFLGFLVMGFLFFTVLLIKLVSSMF